MGQRMSICVRSTMQVKRVYVWRRNDQRWEEERFIMKDYDVRIRM